jgi:hypothetical protein
LIERDLAGVCDHRGVKKTRTPWAIAIIALTTTVAVADEVPPPVETTTTSTATTSTTPTPTDGAAVDATAPIRIEATALRQPEPPPPARPYSPSTALALSIGTTVVGWGVAASGGLTDGSLQIGLITGGLAVAVFGPSAGHVYAHEYRHAIIATTVRAVGVLLVGVGVGAATTCVVGGLGDQDNGCDGGGGGAILIGLGITAGLGLYDWIDSPRAARRANARAIRHAAMAVMPTLDPQRGTTGLALVGSF